MHLTTQLPTKREAAAAYGTVVACAAIYRRLLYKRQET